MSAETDLLNRISEAIRKAVDEGHMDESVQTDMAQLRIAVGSLNGTITRQRKDLENIASGAMVIKRMLEGRVL